MDIENDIIHSGVKSIALMASALCEPRQSKHPNAAPFVVVPAGYEVKAAPTEAVPPRPIGNVKLGDTDSLINFFLDHRVHESRIYLQPAASAGAQQACRCIAVIDDFDAHGRTLPPVDPAQIHGTNKARLENVDEQVGWRQFRATLDIKPSPEWLAWSAINRQPKSQKDFAEFLLDNLPDIEQPDGATVMDLVNNFEASIGGTFMSQQRMQSGDVAITVKSETSGASTIKLPEHLTLSIPVFEREQPQVVMVRLRYRVSTERGLSFIVEIVRPHKVLEAALVAVRQRIEASTGRAALIGSPE